MALLTLLVSLVSVALRAFGFIKAADGLLALTQKPDDTQPLKEVSDVHKKQLADAARVDRDPDTVLGSLRDGGAGQ